MTLFIKKLGIVILIGLGIAFILDQSISHRLKLSDDFAYGECLIWDKIYKGEMNEELLIYGSSRAWVHFDPEIIEKAFGYSTFNLGLDGHNFWLQYLRHKKLLKNNHQPKIILLSVGIFTLNKRKDLYNLDQFLPYIFDLDIYKYTSDYQGFSFFDYTLPLFRYSGRQDAIKQVLLKDKPEAGQTPYRIKGFRAMDRKWNKDLEIAKSKMEHYVLKTHKPSEQLLRRFLQECDSLGIKVVMVYSPEQIDGQVFVKNRAEIIGIYETMAREGGISFLDYSKDPMCENKDLFYNSLHLNATGAKQFSNKLVTDLNEMKIISPKNAL